MLTFSFPYHKITSFENKYGIKFSYFNFHVPFITSCELEGSIKIKMQMYKLLLVLILFRSFSSLLLIEKFYRRFMYFIDTVTYFDKIIMFSYREKANRYIEIYPAIIVLK